LSSHSCGGGLKLRAAVGKVVVRISRFGGLIGGIKIVILIIIISDGGTIAPGKVWSLAALLRRPRELT
jgi:hypothetical protein